MPRQITGKFLKELWGIPAKHVLYSHDGTWYHQLTSFLGALSDSEGYVLFPTERAFHDCPLLRIHQDDLDLYWKKWTGDSLRKRIEK